MRLRAGPAGLPLLSVAPLPITLLPIALLSVALLSVALLSGACTAPPRTQPAPPPDRPATTRAAARVVGYFTDWGIYGRNYQVKDLETSGSAAALTDLVYAFGQVKGGRCGAADEWADYRKPVGAAGSVDGTADPANAALKGNFGQLRKLKARHPGLRVIWSFGGWSGSGGFTDAARDPAAFALSCRDLLHDPRWAGLFDGIDVDWEYPNACGVTCDHSGADGLARVLGALRSALGPDALVTAAVPADLGKLAATDYAAAARPADWLGAMTYDYFGTGGDGGAEGDSADLRRTQPQAPLTAYPGAPQPGANASATVAELLELGVPAAKLLLGVPFYGRGWTGVTSAGVGAPAGGPADGTYEKGLEEYAVLVRRCPPTGTAGGTAVAYCGSQWWSYDTPETIRTKMAYARGKALGGAFAWELSGDTTDAVLLKAMAGSLNP